MGKLCTVTFEKVSISAVQDLLAVKAASTKPIRILRYWLSAVDSTFPSPVLLALRARVATATLTLGSGGSAPTPVNTDVTNTTTISATAHANDTTKATTSGAFTIVDEGGGHVYNGYDSAASGRGPFDVPISGGFVFELITALSTPIVFNGGIDFEEIG